jgi:hypothetical protein
MTYAQGGLIQAADYNGFVGTSPSSTANQINTIWAVGNGQYGYGQTALNQVSTLGLVTGAQWASAVNTLNSINTHQTGSGTGISAPTTGSLVSYLATFSSSLNTAYSNALLYNSQGATTTGSTYYTTSTTSADFTAVNQATSVTFTITRTVTFASADQARYFFNAGGQLNFVMGTATNPGGTSRGADLIGLINTNFISATGFKAVTNGQKTGSGGTLSGGGYTSGYYSLTTSDQTIAKVTSTTSGYSTDYVQLNVKSNGAQGSNADKGTVITFTFTIYSDARATIPAPPANPPGSGTRTVNTIVNDQIDIITPHRIDIIVPESTYLSNSWGSVTVA